MALAYTAPTWTDGSGEGISASNLQAISDCIEGLVQGTDKAIHSIAMANSVITVTFADGSVESVTATGMKGIASIAKTSTSGLVDTYTITYTDGTTSTFTVTNGTSSVVVAGSGTASASVTHQQQISVNGVATDIDGSKYMEIASTSSTTYTFTNAAITSTSAIDVYTDTWGDSPSSVTASSGSCTVTFSEAQTRTVRIYIK